MEYTIAGALVAAVSITALFLMSNKLDSMMENLLQSMRTQNSQVASAQAIATTLSPPTNPTAPATTPNGALDTACFQSGWCIQIPVVNNGTINNTSGANGGQMTHQFSDTIGQVAQHISTQPSADPELLNLITQLANLGHAIGNIEQGVVDLCPPGGSCVASAQGSVPTYEQIHQITGPNVEFQAAYDLLQGYLARNPDSLPPEIVSVIDLETQQIQTIAAAFDPSAVSYQVDPATGLFTETWSIPPNAATLTQQSANTICNSGGGECIQ
jgi:hypothetical protein